MSNKPATSKGIININEYLANPAMGPLESVDYAQTFSPSKRTRVPTIFLIKSPGKKQKRILNQTGMEKTDFELRIENSPYVKKQTKIR